MTRSTFALAIALVGLSAGCKAKLGDSCSVSTDCAVNGGRVCDTASPGGYCTIKPCDPNGCPESALCVEWRYEENRTSETWCMKACSNNGDCDRNGYQCVHEGDPELITPEGESLARVSDFDGRANSGFCVYVGN